MAFKSGNAFVTRSSNHPKAADGAKKFIAGSQGSAGYGDMTKSGGAKKGKAPRVSIAKSSGSANDKVDSGQDGGGKMPMKSKGTGRHLPRDPGSVGGSDGALASDQSMLADLKGKRF